MLSAKDNSENVYLLKSLIRRTKTIVLGSEDFDADSIVLLRSILKLMDDLISKIYLIQKESGKEFVSDESIDEMLSDLMKSYDNFDKYNKVNHQN